MADRPSPAAQLREAAELMRERAGAAHTGPWEISEETGLFGPMAHLCVMMPFRQDMPEARTGLTTYVPLGTQDAETARHIASWHPGVALAVADWLEATAISYDQIAASPYGAAGAAFVAGFEHGDLDPALVVARAYLAVDQ